MKTIEEALQTIKKERKIADSTLTNYRRYMTYIARIVKDKNKKELKTSADIKSLEFLFQEKTVDKLVEHVGTKTSLRGYLNALSMLARYVDPKKAEKVTARIQSEITQINDSQNMTQKMQLKNPKEKANWIDWKQVKSFHAELTTKFNSLKSKKNLDSDQLAFIQSYVILSCYVLIPPRRLQDYSRLYLVDDLQDKFPSESDIRLSDLITVDEKLKENNYILRDDKKKFHFVFNHYKTSKLYGSQKFQMPHALGRIFTFWLKINKERLKNFHFNNEDFFKSPPVFLNKHGKVMTSNNIGETISSIFKNKFKKNIGASMLRHSYVSDYLKNSRTLLDRSETANKMGHSINVAETVYRKLDGKKEKKNEKLAKKLDQ